MDAKKKLEQKKFLLIAGQPKAGTTSLFRWLKQHPDICGSTLKETRFFLSDKYPLKRPFYFNGDNLNEYLDLFEDHARTIFMEATPDYLYDERPLLAANLLPNSKAVVILRDPVKRMISAYRFFQQRGLVSKHMSFDNYVAYQDRKGAQSHTPIQFRALDHCRVNFYLSRWKKAFGNRLLIIKFENLKGDPFGTINQMCEFLDIEKPDINDLNLAQENKTGKSRWTFVTRLYFALQRAFSIRLLNYPSLRKMLRPISRILRKTLVKDDNFGKVAVSARSLAIIQAWASDKP